jgi:uncharacterized protein YndB with AHSA1/START domain
LEEIMEQIIHQQIHLNCTPEKAFRQFTHSEHLERWLTGRAEVEARIGGKYELFWDLDHPERDSTLGCRITALVPDRMLAFDWKGLQEFSDFMNDADPLTHVAVLFFSAKSGTELHLLHSGWRRSGRWPEAQAYFERAWTNALETLQGQIGADDK